MLDPEGFLEDLHGKRVVLVEIHRLQNPSELLKIAADHHPGTYIGYPGTVPLGTARLVPAFHRTCHGTKRGYLCGGPVAIRSRNTQRREHLGRDRSYHPTHASRPDDGPIRSGPLKQFQPEKPVNHMQVYLHIVAPNANGFTIGKDCPSKHWCASALF